MRNNFRSRLLIHGLVAAGLMALIGNASAQAQTRAYKSIHNGSFEQKFSYWTVNPDEAMFRYAATTWRYSTVPLTDPQTHIYGVEGEGTNFAVLTAGVGPQWGAGQYVELTQTFTAGHGDVLSGWAFFDGIRKNREQNDDAAIEILKHNPLTGFDTILSFTLDGLDDPLTPADEGNGFADWQQFSYTFSDQGQYTYTLRAKVRNAPDNTRSSSLGLDGIKLARVTPEGDANLLLGMGLLPIAGLVMRKRRKSGEKA